VNTLKLATRPWMRRIIPSNLWPKLTQYTQLVSSQPLKIGNTMFLIKWRNHSFKKTEMAIMTSLTCTHQASISTHLENMFKLIIKRCLNQMQPNNRWLRLLLNIQLDLSHHLQTINMMFLTSSRAHWIWKIKLMQVIYIITIILSSTSIISEIMHKCQILLCR